MEPIVRKDEQGNEFRLEDNGEMFLNITKEKKKRKIGALIKQQDGTFAYHKRVKEKHIFRANKSWGLNWQVIKEVLPDGVEIIVETEKRLYKIGKAEALEKGEFLWFKSVGFEKQIFVPIKYWTVYKLTSVKQPAKKVFRRL